VTRLQKTTIAKLVKDWGKQEKDIFKTAWRSLPKTWWKLAALGLACLSLCILSPAFCVFLVSVSFTPDHVGLLRTLLSGIAVAMFAISLAHIASELLLPAMILSVSKLWKDLKDDYANAKSGKLTLAKVI